MRKPDPASVICIVLLIITITVLYLRSSKYDELDSKYDKLMDKYDSLANDYDALEEKYYSVCHDHDSYIESVWMREDDAATVFCYFDHDEDITFEEAEAAFLRLEKAVFQRGDL